MYPVSFLAQELGQCALRKRDSLKFWVGLWLVVPGESRVSVGVDCFVPCPPSVAPRIGFRFRV